MRFRALRANRYGIFDARLALKPGGWMRARLPTGEVSLPFAVRKTRDRFVVPFGTV
jgi:hypothetical protein